MTTKIESLSPVTKLNIRRRTQQRPVPDDALLPSDLSEEQEEILRSGLEDLGIRDDETLLPPKISRRQKKILNSRLEELGFDFYDEYLKSDIWKDFKKRYRATARPEPGYRKPGLPQTCAVCSAPNVDLHHKTYIRLGEERLTDVVPLCREHHDQLHEEGLDLFDGPKILHERAFVSRGAKKPLDQRHAADIGREKRKLNVRLAAGLARGAA